MILPNKDEFLKEIDFIDNDSIKNSLIELYDYVKSPKNKDFNTYKTLKPLLNALFNPFKLSKEPVIPFSFFETVPGKLVIAVMSKSNEIYYTITELTEMTITEDRPKGLTKQYLSQEIKEERLKAVKEAGIWRITALEAERYLKSKGIIK